LQARETVAGTLIAQAKEYSDAGRHRVALSILRDAIWIEPQSSFPAARALKAIYQAGVAAAAAEQRAAFLQGATRKGQWKTEGRVKLVPPPVADEPAVILSKTEWKTPYRVQVDVDLEEQPGGGGIVFAAQDAKSYLAVELNTIGMGISVYLTRIRGKERTVIGGVAMTHGKGTPETVTGDGEAAYNAMMLGLPITLIVDVRDHLVIVSSLLGELFRTTLAPDVPTDGRYGVVRVPYEATRGKASYKLELSNLLVESR